MILLLWRTIIIVIAFVSITQLACFSNLLSLVCSFISPTLVIIPDAYFHSLRCIMNAFLSGRGHLMSGSLHLCVMRSFVLKFVSLRFRTLSSSMGEFYRQNPILESMLLSLINLICNSPSISQHLYFQVNTKSKNLSQLTT